MRYGKALFFVIILSFILALVFNTVTYADFPKSISIIRNEQVVNNFFPIAAGFELVGSVSTSMSGTIQFTSQVNPANIINVPVQYATGGWTTQVNLSDVGTYNILETYSLTASIALPGITPATVTETRASSYNNTSAGNKTINMTSSLSGFGLSLPPGKFAAVSIVPPSIEPGGSISATLRATQNIAVGDVIKSIL